MLRPAPVRLAAAERAALGVWAGSRVATYLTVAVAGSLLVTEPDGYLDRWRQWDVWHYEAIAAGGYARGGPTPYAAFFPGLPLVLRGLARLGLDLTAAGLLVSAVAGGVAALALTRLAALDGQSAAGPRAVLLLTCSPAAVFLAAGYTEALFLGLALPAWLAARRGRWWWAGVLAAGAASVRVSGLFLALALAVQWLGGDHRRRGDVFALLLPFLPLAAYMAWLRVSTGDWWAWVAAQRQGWYRDFTDPVTAFARTWGAAFGGGRPAGEAVMFRAELVAVLVGVLLTGWLLRGRRWGEATYVGLQVLAFGTSTWYISVPRATLLWWPLWLGLARLTVRRPGVFGVYLAVAVPLAVLWTAAFATGRWAG